jgi:biopolymer transport protein ExbB
MKLSSRKNTLITVIASLASLAVTAGVWAQTDGTPQAENILAAANDKLAGRLEAATQRLAEIRQKIADEKIPLAQTLAQQEAAVSTLRKDYDAVKRQADMGTLETASLRNEIKQRESERNYLCSLLGEYGRNVETRLHIAELELFKDVFDASKKAQELVLDQPEEAFGNQLCMMLTSLSRLEELAGGLVFKGQGSSEEGVLKTGTFLLFGPVAYFASDDGTLVGVANQRVGSLVAVIEPFTDSAFTAMAKSVITEGNGAIPFDASLGNARKIAETKETVKQHFKKGGPIMWPLFALMCVTGFIVFTQWLYLTFIPMPRRRALAAFLDAVTSKDAARIEETSKKLRGPAGVMLRAGCAVINQPRELIEEAMFEKLLHVKSRLTRFIPFVAVAAACAPLIGLLGTVTGIISTFKLITIFGSGDVKVLSVGISEALITTEYALYIAIPAVLMHAFLSRKAKGVVDSLEQVAIRFMGEVGKI